MADPNLLTPAFTSKELSCPCCGRCEMDQAFMQKLQKLRDVMDRPLTIDSAFRCATHNRAVGGEPNSEHLHGRAADIKLDPSCTDQDRLKMLTLAMSVGMRGFGVARSYLHVDDRSIPRPATMWIYVNGRAC